MSTWKDFLKKPEKTKKKSARQKETMSKLADAQRLSPTSPSPPVQFRDARAPSTNPKRPESLPHLRPAYHSTTNDVDNGEIEPDDSLVTHFDSSSDGTNLRENFERARGSSGSTIREEAQMELELANDRPNVMRYECHGREEDDPDSHYQLVRKSKEGRGTLSHIAAHFGARFDPRIFGKFCDETLVTKRGIIFNILNNQCHGTAQFVRAIRISLEDPLYLPRYIENNLGVLKATAAVLVHEYFLQSRVNLGTVGPITVDEYAPSFTISSLSAAGREALPNGESEGPLWYALCPAMLKKTRLRMLPGGTSDDAYIVNFRLHQVNANIRIYPNEQPKKRSDQFIIIQDPTKKGYSSIAPRTTASVGPPPLKIQRPFNARSRATDDSLMMAREAKELSRDALQKSREAQRGLASLIQSEKVYPTLPERPRPITWPTDGRPGLPDDF